ncbi:MAG: hypothetical protein JWR53_1709 [Glaciihabitans sp.]|jgi:uncharacterized RDD family membrane protein YckC|nr:hypothetical protein [Glaciihabitans sp.]MDQ1556022.1 hypothetical protein [Actinomycetota bacterium]
MPSDSAPDSVAHIDAENELITGEAVALDLRPTSFILAAAGAAIDWLVYFIGGITAVGLLAAFVFSGISDSALQSAVVLASFVVVLVVIPTAVELLTHGKSLGRLAVGARIVRDDGGAIGFRHAFIRSLASLIDFYFTLGGAAALVGLFNGRSKRLGDLIAGTYSQYERVARLSTPVYGVPVELQSWALTADVARMPDGLARRISSFLRHAPHQTQESRDRMSRQLAGETSVWVSPIPDVRAEIFLAAVVVLRRDREYRALQLEQERLERLSPALGGLPHGFPARD